jgi:hypothetical protein
MDEVAAVLVILNLIVPFSVLTSGGPAKIEVGKE